MNGQIRKIILVSIASIFLNACHHLEGDRRAALARETAQAVKPGGLAPRDLKKGTCGIFLWSITDTKRPLVFFQQAGSRVADAHILGETIQVKQVKKSASVVPGFYQQQQFKYFDQTLRIRVQADAGRNLISGIKIPAGVLSFDDKDKGSMVLPVTGIFACNLDK